MFISNAYAQAAGAAPAFSFQDVLLPLVMVVLVWLLMFRPQMKKHKEHQKLVSELQKGDEVVTNGGIAGRIAKVDENFVTLEIAANTNVLVQKQAISTVLPKGTLKGL